MLEVSPYRGSAPGESSSAPRLGPASPNASLRTPSVTVLPPICWRAEPIFERFRKCWDTPTLLPPRSTPMSPPNISARSTSSTTLGRELQRRLRADPGSCRIDSLEETSEPLDHEGRLGSHH